MRVLTAGASGFLGTRLVTRLRDAGHDVVRLVRREPASSDERRWDPAAGELDPSTLDGVNAVVNLSGANIGGKRWTPEYKRELLDSRLSTTGTLARAIAAHAGPIAFLSGSAVGIYGDRGDAELTESAGPGSGFFAEMATAWEGATAPARDAGSRVVLMRTGLPLHPAGGVLQPLMLPFKAGVGGPIGNGRSFIPWISMRDWLGAVEFLLERDDLSGPVNLTGPEPVRWKDLAKAIGSALHRPALFPVPKAALNVVVGSEFATEMLASQRVVPAVLSEHGFAFTDRTVTSATAAVLRG
ncbi:TIGR01777 family oxidoreductase [Virgisporangium ochraceum]|uniref:NAD-dependent epimerase/dehydratase n=1 Tax=Virgisporangium ochraceum TaxID=65505 RepID=A0A8J3ZTF4_9ACTN|nr:TIGR01777 family oxidoreductase [Virgisporangium ochraceum]GIJ68748.1 hypothetical protein Voc01_036650 [Virgisporangium ochraceum]